MCDKTVSEDYDAEPVRVGMCVHTLFELTFFE